MSVQIKKLNPKARMPFYATPGSAGFDLRACLDEPLTIAPGQTVKVPTGIAIWVGDPGFALKIMARSGLASKGVALGNGVGLVDSDYQGECVVLLHNRNAWPMLVEDGDRIAQGVIEPVVQAHFHVVTEFTDTTNRGAGGFGSTGTGRYDAGRFGT